MLRNVQPIFGDEAHVRETYLLPGGSGCIRFAAGEPLFWCANMRGNEGVHPMLHNIVLILLGLILIGVLTAIFETMGLKNHPYVARVLAAVCIIIGAYIHWGYHTWWQVLIVIGFGFAYLQILKEFQRQWKKESH